MHTPGRENAKPVTYPKRPQKVNNLLLHTSVKMNSKFRGLRRFRGQQRQVCHTLRSRLLQKPVHHFDSFPRQEIHFAVIKGRARRSCLIVPRRFRLPADRSSLVATIPPPGQCPFAPRTIFSAASRIHRFNRSATAASPNSLRPCSRPRCDILHRIARSSRSRSNDSANASSSPHRNPVSSVTCSRNPPRASTTGTHPARSDSATTRPNVSVTVGWWYTRASHRHR